mmetsp:Transcript_27021/g.71072  ORF Transcript_27021/g.71072 Transcript_27021/m.71072 type:complete len:213 (-) Transcript_27021:2-640(-)
MLRCCRSLLAVGGILGGSAQTTLAPSGSPQQSLTVSLSCVLFRGLRFLFCFVRTTFLLLSLCLLVLFSLLLRQNRGFPEANRRLKDPAQPVNLPSAPSCILARLTQSRLQLCQLGTKNLVFRCQLSCGFAGDLGILRLTTSGAEHVLTVQSQSMCGVAAAEWVIPSNLMAHFRTSACGQRDRITSFCTFGKAERLVQNHGRFKAARQSSRHF